MAEPWRRLMENRRRRVRQGPDRSRAGWGQLGALSLISGDPKSCHQRVVSPPAPSLSPEARPPRPALPSCHPAQSLLGRLFPTWEAGPGGTDSTWGATSTVPVPGESSQPTEGSVGPSWPPPPLRSAFVSPGLTRAVTGEGAVGVRPCREGRLLSGHQEARNLSGCLTNLLPKDLSSEPLEFASLMAEHSCWGMLWAPSGSRDSQLAWDSVPPCNDGTRLTDARGGFSLNLLEPASCQLPEAPSTRMSAWVTALGPPRAGRAAGAGQPPAAGSLAPDRGLQGPHPREGAAVLAVTACSFSVAEASRSCQAALSAGPTCSRQTSRRFGGRPGARAARGDGRGHCRVHGRPQ